MAEPSETDARTTNICSAVAEQRVTDEQAVTYQPLDLDEVQRVHEAQREAHDVVPALITELRHVRAELARYKAATAEAHQIMEAAIVRGGYRPGEAGRVTDRIGTPVGGLTRGVAR